MKYRVYDNESGHPDMEISIDESTEELEQIMSEEPRRGMQFRSHVHRGVKPLPKSTNADYLSWFIDCQCELFGPATVLQGVADWFEREEQIWVDGDPDADPKVKGTYRKLADRIRTLSIKVDKIGGGPHYPSGLYRSVLQSFFDRTEFMDHPGPSKV